MTAVDTLWDMIPKDTQNYIVKQFNGLEKAKAMENDRLISAQMDMFHFLNNLKSGMMYLEKREEAEKFAKQYYNETNESDL